MSICKIGHLQQYELHKMKNKLIIRDYKNGDFEKVQSFWELLKMGGEERKDDNDVIMRTIKNGGKLIILEKNNSIIGTAWLTNDTRRTYFHHFGIHPDFQKQGYGTKLMNECMKYIKEKGLQVKIEVHKKNIAALKLYRNFGFVDFPEYELMMLRDI
ncbi:MAG: GNAT family N-acetyltransferase [Chlorobi bacterium]|nr:GNAT family N-acetyltransferase [Chlorobiota bacterium]